MTPKIVLAIPLRLNNPNNPNNPNTSSRSTNNLLPPSNRSSRYPIPTDILPRNPGLNNEWRHLNSTCPMLWL